MDFFRNYPYINNYLCNLNCDSSNWVSQSKKFKIETISMFLALEMLRY